MGRTVNEIPSKLEVVVEKQKLSSERTLEAIIKDLPPDLQQEVADFAHFLWQTKIKRKTKPQLGRWSERISPSV